MKKKDTCQSCASGPLKPEDGPVRLTRLVERTGCASKINQAALKRILAGLPEIDDARVLVGVSAGDDAGVFKLNENLALVQTVDVFSPPVDDPYTFGQVAAANSLSDVYAMGGRPISALSVIAFPISTVHEQVMHDILHGGIDKMAEAGVPVIGGHSVKNDEIKAGFAVTGLIDPNDIITNAGVEPGDVLVLTKPIGMGIVGSAARTDRASAEAVAATVDAMTTLNRTASELMREFDAHACTDITGFGLIGHLSSMVSASAVDVEIIWDDIPLFPDVIELMEQGIIPGCVERNRESSASAVDMDEHASPEMLGVCLDPQTSGGLLIAVPAKNSKELVDRLRKSGLTTAAVIGKVSGKGTGRIRLTTRRG